MSGEATARPWRDRLAAIDDPDLRRLVIGAALSAALIALENLLGLIFHWGFIFY